MNQQGHWDAIHSKGNLGIDSYSPEAAEILPKVSGKNTLLEVGTGRGFDAEYFAANGFEVLATDFSQAAIKSAANRNQGKSNLQFKQLDTLNLEELLPRKFDVIYSRLALHYFSDEDTRKIIEVIYQLLSDNGLFIFICKSTSDPLYGKGELLEKNMYILDGHVRHFFDEEYIKDLLQGKFEIKEFKSGEEEFYGKKSAFVKVVARKR